MNHALRAGHRRTWMALAVGLPALWVGFFVLGRPPAPAPSNAILLAANQFQLPGGERIATHERLGAQGRFDLEVWSSEGDVMLRLLPREVVLHPDVLLYWTPPNQTEPGEDAEYLGTLRGLEPRTLVLESTAVGRNGALLLYSVGHAKVVDRITLPAEWTADLIGGVPQ